MNEVEMGKSIHTFYAPPLLSSVGKIGPLNYSRNQSYSGEKREGCVHMQPKVFNGSSGTDICR